MDRLIARYRFDDESRPGADARRNITVAVADTPQISCQKEIRPMLAPPEIKNPLPRTPAVPRIHPGRYRNASAVGYAPENLRRKLKTATVILRPIRSAPVRRGSGFILR